MFNFKKMKKSELKFIEDYVNKLIDNKLNNLPIGKVYCKVSRSCLGNFTFKTTLYPCVTKGVNECEWIEFSESDITDKIDNKIKIKDCWFDKTDVIWFNNYSKKKKRIEDKYKTEEK